MLTRQFPFIVFLVFFCACASTSHVSKIETNSYRIAGGSSVDSSIDQEILPYRKQLEADMNAVLAVSDQPLEKGTPEGLLGDFAADACMAVSSEVYPAADGKKIDFLFLNNGGLRNPLPAGSITKGNVFELMPFENELVVLHVPGGVVKKIFNFLASKDGAPVSGVRFGIQGKEAVNITIQNESFDSTRTYQVVTSDYLANGGDQLMFLAAIREREPLGLKVRDAIIRYLQKKNSSGEHILVKKDQRISHVE